MYESLINERGVQQRTPAESLRILTEALRKIKGLESLDLSSSTLDGSYINILIEAITDINEQVIKVQKELDISTAEGVNLDKHGIQKGILRESGESDAVYRQRMLGPPAGRWWTLSAQISALGITGVEDCFIYDHETDDAIPEGTVKFYFRGGTAADIGKLIKAVKPIGIATEGSEVAPILVEQPNGTTTSEILRYNIGTPIQLKVNITIKYNGVFNLIHDQAAIKKLFTDRYAATKFSEEILIGNFVTMFQVAFPEWSVTRFRFAIGNSELAPAPLKPPAGSYYTLSSEDIYITVAAQ